MGLDNQALDLLAASTRSATAEWRVTKVTTGCTSEKEREEDEEGEEKKKKKKKRGGAIAYANAAFRWQTNKKQ